MLRNTKVWIPVAYLLTVGNIVAVYFAASAGEPWHATIHAALTGLCTVWVDWLRSRQPKA